MSDTIPQDAPKLQCAKCKEWLPLTSENFFRDKNYPTGFRNQCKKCLERVPLPGTEQRRGRRVGTHLPERPGTSSTKVCSKCCTEKPLDQFGVQKKGTYGVRAVCKECRKIESQEFYARRYGKKREALPDPANGGKICRRCHAEKPYAQFSPDKRAKDGLTTQCRQCVQEVQEPHAERNLIRGRAIRERDKERYREKSRIWHRNHPLVARQLIARREAIKKLTHVEKRVDYLHILERDNCWCYICNDTIYPDQRIAFDHVIPLIPRQGTGRTPGSHSEDNIKVTHYLCNARKGNRSFEELAPYHRRGVSSHFTQPQLLNVNTYDNA